MSDKAADYNMSNSDAEYLMGACGLPLEFRVKLLDKYARENGVPALVVLFSQFIGLANSVVANNRECIELFAIVDGDVHPYQAEKYNLPTIFGALQGCTLANRVNQIKTCGGCAYRRGTPANQSPVTTCDAEWCADGSEQFHCHETLDEQGTPRGICAGYAQDTRHTRAA